MTITQRPANVSKYLLSQSNTMVVFRLVNDSDIKAISDSAESASEGILRLLPSLKTGEGFVFGLGSPLPVLVDMKEN